MGSWSHKKAIPWEGELGLFSYQALLGPDERSVLPIHLVIEATGIT